MLQKTSRVSENLRTSTQSILESSHSAIPRSSSGSINANNSNSSDHNSSNNKEKEAREGEMLPPTIVTEHGSDDEARMISFCLFCFSFKQV